MTKIGRNAPCPCGSGLKYKRCCEEKDLAADISREDAQLAMEMALSDIVSQNVLAGVWAVFHPENTTIPDIEVLEDFYFEIYGYDLDQDALDELILPLPPRMFDHFATPTPGEGPVIDLEPEPDDNSSSESKPPIT